MCQKVTLNVVVPRLVDGKLIYRIIKRTVASRVHQSALQQMSRTVELSFS